MLVKQPMTAKESLCWMLSCGKESLKLVCPISKKKKRERKKHLQLTEEIVPASDGLPLLLNFIIFLVRERERDGAI